MEATVTRPPKWAVQMFISEQMADECDDAEIIQFLEPMLTSNVQEQLDKLNQGAARWHVASSETKVQRHMPFEYGDTIDEDGNWYNLDGSDVVSELRSFVVRIVQFVLA